MFRVTRYPMISKTESGGVGYRQKYWVAGRVRVPAGHCWYLTMIQEKVMSLAKGKIEAEQQAAVLRKEVENVKVLIWFWWNMLYAVFLQLFSKLTFNLNAGRADWSDACGSPRKGKGQKADMLLLPSSSTNIIIVFTIAFILIKPTTQRLSLPSARWSSPRWSSSWRSS